MHEVAQVKAAIPRALKRRAFAAFALRDEKFNRWLRKRMEAWLDEVEGYEEAADSTHAQARTAVAPAAWHAVDAAAPGGGETG